MGKQVTEQTIINWIVAGFGSLIGFLLNNVWQAVKDLQQGDLKLVTKMAEMEVLVAGNYMKRDDPVFHSSIDAIFKKLDKIEEKLDKKVDK